MISDISGDPRSFAFHPPAARPRLRRATSGLDPLPQKTPYSSGVHMLTRHVRPKHS